MSAEGASIGRIEGVSERCAMKGEASILYPALEGAGGVFDGAGISSSC
jgi:hypothetical protein